MLCRAMPDGCVVVESADNLWSTAEENGKQLNYSCLENTMNRVKRQEDMTPEDEHPGQ